MIDPRLNPDRPGIEGTLRRLAVAIAGVHREPRADAMQTTQALMGEPVRVFEEHAGWAWCQLERDGYVGYLPAGALSAAISAPTHRVCVPSTFMFPKADIKSGPAVVLTMNAEVAVVDGDEKFLRLVGGAFVFARHLMPLGQYEADFVAVAERFLHVPYLWGGKSVLGLDCSGLVQLSLEACGIPSPRDSDMQEAAFAEVPFDTLRRGDLVFWNDHVGIMTDADTLLHANGFHLKVTREPVLRVMDRIALSGGKVTSFRRPVGCW